MKSNKEINCIDTWIPEEELPVRAGLKVIRIDDPDYGHTEDEIQDRNEFIRCYMMKDFELFTLIPKQLSESDFFIIDFNVLDEEYSAFNTHDFQELLRPFNRYGYAMKKIMERVKDLAILHSSISSQEGRSNTYRRYEHLVEQEFRNHLMALIDQYRWTDDEDRRFSLKGKIGEVNRRILECKNIWEQFAPWDT